MNVLGISAFFHESSCCLLREGKLVAAVAEERFSRLKHDAALPVQAFRYCLEAGALDVVDLDAVAYYESPTKKLARQLWTGLPKGGPIDLPWLDALQPERAIRERLGWDGRLFTYDHHRSHAASAFYFSGFEEAAALTVDGVGEWATTTYGHGEGARLESFEEVTFPHSLGLLYSTITAYLGFKVNSGEYKVMGLAPYGEPRYVEQMRELIFELPGGQFELALEYFDFVTGTRMYSPQLCDLFGRAAREPQGEVGSFHQDVARSLQVTLEEILLAKVQYLAERTGSRRLCMAGGVALNCVANGRIRREGSFDEVFVQPAAGDSGGCLGAAALAHVELTGERPSIRDFKQAFLGPGWDAPAMSDVLQAAGLVADDFRGRQAELVETVAARLAAGEVVGWFQGRMEHGPRALGARSILASPLLPDIQERINAAIKRREPFRPFAPAVLLERAEEFFDLRAASPSKLTPFMLETCQVASIHTMPAITHVDGSARPQTVDRAESPRFAALLDAFSAITGYPVLLNTSFNVPIQANGPGEGKGEPIVCTPSDALACFAVSGLDALILGDFLLDRSMLPDSWPSLASLFRAPRLSTLAARERGVSDDLYTFV